MSFACMIAAQPQYSLELNFLMNPVLQNRFETLENRKQIFMTVLETSTSQQLTFKPTPEAWNMLEVAQHLIKVERGLFAPALKGVDVGQVTLRSRLGYWFIMATFKTPLKVKVPSKAKGAEPKAGEILELKGIQEGWQMTREQLRAYLEPQPVSARSTPVTRHPFVDPMTLGQMLGFFDVHIAHHQHQLNRLQNAEGFQISKRAGCA
jgi:DinB superfamily